MKYLIFHDSSQNDLIIAAANDFGNDIIEHYAEKFPKSSYTHVDILPSGFECGPLAKTQWRYNEMTKCAEQIIPTAAELLATAKAEKKAKIKKITSDHILSEYQIYRQLNVLMDGIETDIASMRTFVQADREKSDIACADIDALGDIDAIVKYKFDIIAAVSGIENVVR